jgi:hypothetical protein
MAKRLMLLSLCALVFSACVTTEERIPETRPVVKTVTIEENAAWSDGVSSDEPPESCSDFVLDASDVREFFKVAREATHTEYNHDLLMSRCYASGFVTLQDGSKASWRIDRARRGRLVLPDKSSLFFFCGECRSKAYGEACDIDCINAD